MTTNTARHSALAAVALLLSACTGLEAENAVHHVFSPSGDMVLVEGVLVLPEGAALPPTTRAEVRLVDLDRSDDDGAFLVASSVTDADKTPVPFRLGWRPDTLPEGHRYVVQGRLIGRSGALYASETPVAVGSGLTSQEIRLELVRTEADTSDDEGTVYSLEGIPDPSETQNMPISNRGDLENLYDTRQGNGDSLYDYINSDAYDGRVITPNRGLPQ